jgi:hypothetical protein
MLLKHLGLEAHFDAASDASCKPVLKRIKRIERFQREVRSVEQ